MLPVPWVCQPRDLATSRFSAPPLLPHPPFSVQQKPTAPFPISLRQLRSNCMILRMTSATPGSRSICARVARVSALTGFNEAFPKILTQISCRMWVVIGHAIRKSPELPRCGGIVPSAIRPAPQVKCGCPQYAERLPARRSPLTMRRASMAAEITPPGSIRSRRSPSHCPPKPWKYHHRIPF